VARNRREGDKILSGGMHKSVKKLMCDKKIPSDERDSLPIICDGDGIILIPSVAIRDKAKNQNGSISVTIYK
jgi:tRNA(Ile)-lysidine synthase